MAIDATLRSQLSRLALALLAAAGAGLGIAPATAAAAGQVEWSGVDRVVAFADVHGAYAEVTALLQSVQVVDSDLHWSGGKTHLVSLGDLLDRGDESRKVMDLLMRLQQEATAAGGQVHVVLGNHETMNVLGDLRYVNKGEFASYVADEDAAVRAEQKTQFLARQPGSTDADFERLFPPGFFGQRRMLAPDGKYGAWLLTLPAMIVINDTVYMHGGPSTALGGRSVVQVDADYSAAVSSYIAAESELRKAGLIQPEDAYAKRPDLAQSRLDALPAEQKASLGTRSRTVQDRGRLSAARRDRTELVSRRGALQRVRRVGRAEALPAAYGGEARGGRSHGGAQRHARVPLRRRRSETRRRHEPRRLQGPPGGVGLGRVGITRVLREPHRGSRSSAGRAALPELADAGRKRSRRRAGARHDRGDRDLRARRAGSARHSGRPQCRRHLRGRTGRYREARNGGLQARSPARARARTGHRGAGARRQERRTAGPSGELGQRTGQAERIEGHCGRARLPGDFEHAQGSARAAAAAGQASEDAFRRLVRTAAAVPALLCVRCADRQPRTHVRSLHVRRGHRDDVPDRTRGSVRHRHGRAQGAGGRAREDRTGNAGAAAQRWTRRA